MKRNYLITALVFLVLAAGLVFLKQPEEGKEIKPQKLFSSLNLPNRYISTDIVASRIIKDDPALCLIDVRDAREFNDFSLQGAINIPLPNILDAEYKEVLKQEGMDFVFYSNDDITAENAWLIASRLGYNNLYILKGGLNRWVETILNPAEPPQTAPSEEWTLYDARMASKQYFLGSNLLPSGKEALKEKNAPPKTIKPVKQAATEHSEGC